MNRNQRSSKISNDTVKSLEAIVGKENCLTDPEDLKCYGCDASKYEYLPDAVLLPENAGQIPDVLRLANLEKFPVVPRGAGSGLTGGTLPVYGGVVLSLKRMNRIIDIDEENLTTRVQPGVVTADLQKAVAKRGLFYPPDPSSLAFSTIGGNIASCAGGPRAVKYGVTRDYVIGLQAVLPTGEPIRTGVRTAKGVVGYDLTKLIVGSEGTLAVVTEAVLKLIPQPESRRTLLAAFEDLLAAARTVTRIIKARIIPCALEFMDANAIQCVAQYQNVQLPKSAGAMLLIEVDGAQETVVRHTGDIKRLCLEEGAVEIETAASDADSEKLWNARRAVAPSLFKIKPFQISEDIVVPRSRIPEMVGFLQAIGRRLRLDVVCFGHAGDGNIHVCIMVDPKDSDEMRRVRQAVSEIFDQTIQMGGTLSGEHGVGITKAPYIRKEIDAFGIDVMRRIKAAFDPNNVLNPGKIFPDEASVTGFMQ
jgi:glycolate oxidase